MWNIEYFTWESGNCPAAEFRDSLDPEREQPFVRNMINRLSEEGNNLKYPFSEPLKDGIFELRIRTRDLKLRFFYFFFDGKNIVITHGIKKKKWSVNAEIKIAKSYRSKYLESRKK